MLFRSYFSILQVIAAGNHKLGDIATALQMQSNRLTAHLDKLRELDLIERVVPVTEINPAKSRKGLYVIKDLYFRFWFRYIFPYQGELEMGRPENILSRIQREWNEYMGFVFEEVCRQLVYYYSPFSIQRSGNYWEKELEIDLMALNETSKEILFGECKWSNQPTDLRVYNELVAKAEKVPWHNEKRKEYFILFSKNGFHSSLINKAKTNRNIILIDWRKINSIKLVKS